MWIDKISWEQLSEEQKLENFKVEFMIKNNDKIRSNILRIWDKKIRFNLFDYWWNWFWPISIFYEHGQVYPNNNRIDHCYLLANILLNWSDYEILSIFWDLTVYLEENLDESKPLPERSNLNLIEDFLLIKQNTLKDYLRMKEFDEWCKKPVKEAVNTILLKTTGDY